MLKQLTLSGKEINEGFLMHLTTSYVQSTVFQRSIAGLRLVVDGIELSHKV